MFDTANPLDLVIPWKLWILLKSVDDFLLNNSLCISLLEKYFIVSHKDLKMLKSQSPKGADGKF